jgi:oligoendopeptidase F
MPRSLPAAADDLDISSWEALEPYYDDLLERSASQEPTGSWVADWSRMSALVQEAGSLLSIRYTQDTEDTSRREAYLRFVREVSPRLRTADQALKRRLLDAGWTSDGMTVPLRQMRAEDALFRDENVPLLAEEQATAMRYGEIVGSLTVDFDGEERTLTALAPYRERPDRGIREAAWRAGYERMLSVRGELDQLFEELLPIRLQIAANAGYDNYRDYKWQQLGRFDYTPGDAVRFQEAVLEVGVPALERQAERRADALGLPLLRPWDLEVDPYADAPLQPFETGDELAATATAIFDRVDPRFGAMMRVMRDEDLLDLDNRKGKAPGGYCATLSARGRPFIFMNAVGTEDNVRTMLHEAGHAFHVFERHDLPLIWQRRTPMEFAEVASMSMELLTSPYIGADEGGFYGPVEAVRSRLRHLERMITFLPFMATVDAFQHWLYANPDHDRQARDAAWLALHESYCVSADWEGLAESRRSLWQHKLHIFEVPFYYIEYGRSRSCLPQPARSWCSTRTPWAE